MVVVIPEFSDSFFILQSPLLIPLPYFGKECQILWYFFLNDVSILQLLKNRPVIKFVFLVFVIFTQINTAACNFLFSNKES